MSDYLLLEDGGRILREEVGGFAFLNEITLLAQDRQTVWKPVFLVDVVFPTVTKHFATIDVDLLTTAYEGRLIDSPSITRRLPDSLYGIVEAQDVRIRVSNVRGDLTSGFTGELRGRKMQIRRYDRYSGTTVTEWSGIVTAAGLDPGELWIEGSNVDLSILDEPFPRNALVTTAAWPSAKDVDAVIPLTFGNHTKVPLPYVKEDQVNDIYDYLLGFDDALAGVTASTLFRRVDDTLFEVETQRKVIVNNVSQSSFTAASSTWAHTCTGSDRCLVVLVSSRTQAVSTVTYGGVSLTKIGEVGAQPTIASIWYLLNPAKGTADIVATMAASSDTVATGVSLIGVLQTMQTADFGFASATGTSAAPSVTVSGALAVDMVFDVVTVRLVSGEKAYAGSAQTLIWNEPYAVAFPIQSLGSKETGESTDVMSWTLEASNQWAAAAIKVKPASTYSINRTAYTGYVVARFTYRQTDLSGGTLSIYGDITGMSVERNFASAIKSVLSNTAWGLSQSVNAASFTAAASALDTLGLLYCDGSIYGDQLTSREVLQQLCMPRSMRLAINADGEWIITVDAAPTDMRMAVQGGAATDGEKNVVKSGNRRVVSIEEATKEFALQYRWDEPSEKYLFEQKRTVSSYGATRKEENAFIRNHATADKVTCYLAKRLSYAQQSVEITLPQEARKLTEGDLILVTYAPLGLSAVTMEVLEVIKGIDQITATLIPWGVDIYTYVAGTLPNDSTLGSPEDYSRTPPSPATNLAVVTGGATTSPGGKVDGWIKLRFDTPETNCAKAMIRWRRIGETFWNAGVESPELGVRARAIVHGLAPNTTYEFTVSIVNAFGLTSVGDPTVVSTVPANTDVPDAPSAVTVTAYLKFNLVKATATPPSDWGTTRFYRHTSNNSGSATEIGSGKTLWFSDNTAAYGTQYWYWVKIEDTSGNLSGFSPSGTAGAANAKVAQADIGAGAVGTTELGTSAATEAVSDVETGAEQLTDTTFTDIPNSSISVSAPGGVPILIIGSLSVLGSQSTGAGITSSQARLVRDSTVLQTGTIRGYLSGVEVVYTPVTFAYIDSPSVGTYTYKLQYKAVFSNHTVIVGDRTLQAVVLKR